MQEDTADDRLLETLRATTGTAPQRIDQALTLLLDELDMQVAYVSEFRDGQRVVTHSISAPGGPQLPPGTTHPVQETLCHLFSSRAVPAMVPDLALEPVLAGHPHTLAFGVASHAGLPLQAHQQVVGAVCLASTRVATTWSRRDEATLRAVVSHINDLLSAELIAE